MQAKSSTGCGTFRPVLRRLHQSHRDAAMAAAGLPFCGINLTPTGYTWPLNGDSRDWADGDWGGWCSSEGRGRPRCVCRRRGAEGQRRRRVGRGQVDDELFAVGKPVSRRRSSTSKYCLGRSACIQCTGSPWQWGLVSEPWPAICCCSTLASMGAFTVECLVWQGRSKDRADRESNEHQQLRG
jgi:hypothetical protein